MVMTTRELAKDRRYGGIAESGGSVRSGGSAKSTRSVVSARNGASGGSGMSAINGSTMGARIDTGGQGGASTMDFVPAYAFRQLEKDNASSRKQIRAMENMAGRQKRKAFGRNNLKKVDWSPIDVDNECTINDYCWNMVYPFYKYLPKGW